jgi:hypothetical protein
MALDFLGDTSQYFNNYTPSDMVGNTFPGVSYDYNLPTNIDTSNMWNESVLSGGDGFNLGSLPWGNIIGTLGKLGAGIGGFISAREANKTPYLVPTTQWLGNGLAKTGYVDMSKIRQNKLDQATGATSAVGQAFELFGNRLGKNKLDNIGADNDYLASSDFESWLNNKRNEYQNTSPNYNGWQV